MVDWWRPTELPIDPFGTPDTGFDTFRVTSPFGVRNDPLGSGGQVFHGGLDIGNARLGDKLVAVADGRVVDVGPLKEPWSQSTTRWPTGNFGGLMVILGHENTHISLYAHMSVIACAKGQIVKAGEIVGRVGETGSATGQGHLHFGISDHSAREIIEAKRLLPNAWCVDPWPLIKRAAAEEGTLGELAECRELLAKRAARIKELESRISGLRTKVDQLEGLDAVALLARLEELKQLANQPLPEVP